MNNYAIRNGVYYINILTWAGSRTISMEGVAVFYDIVNSAAEASV